MKTKVDDKIEKFFSNFKSISFKKGKIIIQPDQKIENAYFIVRGKIRMFTVSDNGQEVTLHIYGPGTIIPVALLICGGYGKFYHEALENINAIQAPSEEVMEFIKGDKDILLEFTTRFAKAMLGLTQRVEEALSNNSYSRVANLLLYFGKKFGEKDGEKNKINLSLRHEDISNWLGLRRETVSRQLGKMQKQGIIVINHKSISINPQKLKTSVKHK